MIQAKSNPVPINYVNVVLRWLPSTLVAFFFIQNALEKILSSATLEKAGLSPTQILIAGFMLLIATALYLIEKTKIVGTILLALYMTGVVYIHFMNGKPYIIAAQIVLAIIYGAYFRKVKIVAKE